MFGQIMKMNSASSSGLGLLPSNTVPNPREDLKAITTHSGVTFAGPSSLPPPSKEVDQDLETIMDQMPEVTKYTVQPSTENIQPLVTQTQVPINEPIVAPKPKPTIPYSSRVNKQKLLEKDDNLALNFVEIFRNLHFKLSFADALLHMPKFALMFKSFLNNKEKLFDLATNPVYENCLVNVSHSMQLRHKTAIVDYVVEPRVPLILGRPFLRTGRALIDVYREELTLCVDGEAITFKVVQTSKHSNNDVESINQIDVIDVACEEYVQEIPSGIDDTDLDLEGDIRILEELLNNDPSLSPLPPKELNVEEIKTIKSSIDEPPELELKELSSHLEYAFLEGTDKLPVIISKELKDEEKSALLKVLKSHKRAIVLKISNIKGIDPHFYTYKILMEDDFKPTIQHHRRVNPKIHEVIKKEVIKLLDAGLIYSDSPWVNPVHCVPKKGGMTVVKNEDNDLIPTRCQSIRCPCYGCSTSARDGVLFTTHLHLCFHYYEKSTFRFRMEHERYFRYNNDSLERRISRLNILSRLENPHQDELEKKEITKTFPLETLGMIAFHGDSSTPWFADFANYHAGNFIVKGMSS
nr:reverse transcriptase domain-containing protein [Tanacetum cinerariifolium]